MPRKPAKRGPGRPSLGADARSVTRTIKLTPGEAAAQDALASRAGQTWTDLVREALDLALARGSTR